MRWTQSLIKITGSYWPTRSTLCLLKHRATIALFYDKVKLCILLNFRRKNHDVTTVPSDITGRSDAAGNIIQLLTIEAVDKM